MDGTTQAKKPSGHKSAKAPRAARQAKPPQPRLNDVESGNVRGYLRTVACSDAWVDHILFMLTQTDTHGRPIVKHKVDAHGNLKGEKKTKYARLLTAVADALVYPPPVDDQPRTFDLGPDNRVEHTGSAMKPCHCQECTRINPDGSRRHVHWPASYMVNQRSYTCWLNEQRDSENQSFFTNGSERGRGLGVGEAAEQIRVDVDAWRSDDLENLSRFARDSARELSDPRLLLLDDPVVNAALESHEWTQVTGDAGNVRNQTRGLSDLGSLVDFLELGHSLAEVRGLSVDDAALIADLVDAYPREARLRQVRIKWQEIRQ